MKIARFFSGVFSVLGTVLLVGTVALCLFNLNSEPKLDTIPAEAGVCAEAFFDALNAGDLEAARELIYGQPDLGAETGDPGTEILWETFRGSITCQVSPKVYAVGAEIFRDAAVTTLDVEAVLEKVPALAAAYVKTQAEQAEDPDAAYSPQALDAALQKAVEQALQAGETVSYDVTVQLVQRSGRWWVIPDTALLKAISGGAG